MLGASVDLAKKKTFPALFHLYHQGFLQSNEVHIFGYARTKISDDELRNCIRGHLTPCKGDCTVDYKENVSKFLQLVKYVVGTYDTEEGFQALDKEIYEHELEKKTVEGSSRRLFYLALPPSLILVGGLGFIEKPFGKDLESVEQLSNQIGSLFDEPQIYRIDHYLGKELVQNLLVFRFANCFFLPLWNHDNVDNVEVMRTSPLTLDQG